MLAISKLPSAGLGNKLFSWAAGVIFAKRNNCKHFTVGLTRLHLGPYLRGERSKRFYVGYFKSEKLFYRLALLGKRGTVVPQQECDRIVGKNGIFIFNEISHWSDHFITIKSYRTLVIAAFWKDLTEKVQNRIALHIPPYISVHIRMGDFRTLKIGEDFGQVGAVRTPISYFKEVICKIRQTLYSDTHVTIFSDGNDIELEELLNLPNIERAKDDLDIVHLAVLSKSKIIIMSAGSSFSFWAGFLSDAILINHYQHINGSIRPYEINKTRYEGALHPDKIISEYPLLEQNLWEVRKTI